ncbi:MAG: methylated-DNA--[protein]-cysteine S-methyltransferase [Chloroflexia bacterium]
MPNLYWRRFPSPWGSLRLLATDSGLCRVVLPAEGGVERWVARFLSGHTAVEGGNFLQEAVRQLERYLAGQLRAFDLPLDLYGTAFQKAVWQALRSIPYGQVWSYAQVADAVGRPQAARAVGVAVAANPLPIVIPCHRVIRADGTLGGYGGGTEMKRDLLRLEGCNVASFVLESKWVRRRPDPEGGTSGYAHR